LYLFTITYYNTVYALNRTVFCLIAGSEYVFGSKLASAFIEVENIEIDSRSWWSILWILYD